MNRTVCARLLRWGYDTGSKRSTPNQLVIYLTACCVKFDLGSESPENIASPNRTAHIQIWSAT